MLFLYNRVVRYFDYISLSEDGEITEGLFEPKIDLVKHIMENMESSLHSFRVGYFKEVNVLCLKLDEPAFWELCTRDAHGIALT